MATSADLLLDTFGRVREIVHRAVNGATPGQLAEQLDDQANSIGWLIWHLARVQDDHVADVAEVEQVWTAQGWDQRFDLPFPPKETGYGQSGEHVAAVRVGSPELLTGYYDAVHQMTVEYVRGLTDADYDRIVDEAWDPPVSLGVRLVSVVSDTLQHAGQAAFVRGVLDRAKK